MTFADCSFFITRSHNPFRKPDQTLTLQLIEDPIITGFRNVKPTIRHNQLSLYLGMVFVEFEHHVQGSQIGWRNDDSDIYLVYFVHLRGVGPSSTGSKESYVGGRIE
jgi:hypothetical protein